ncbi:MAG: hypothetical protein J6Y20_12420 [Lachnospiraceae bacterium]|nr:hypothetical protein [Lachnospiraceae bacterium]
MPNRFLKENICISEDIDNLTLFEEVFFYRLIVNCDDFGRTDARGKILKSRLFPLREVPLEDIDSAVKTLVRNNMIFIYTVDDREYIQVTAWEKHQQRRATSSKYPEPIGWKLIDGVYIRDTDAVKNHAEDITDDQKISDDNNGYQMISDDIRCHRYSNNDIRNNDIRNTNTNTDLTHEDAVAIIREHDQVISAAENAGFKMSETVRSMLIDLYSEHGLSKMLEAIKACAVHGVFTVAYLRGVLNGEPKKKTEKKRVAAQEYTQRDYSGAQMEAMKAMVAMAETG